MKKKVFVVIFVFVSVFYHGNISANNNLKLNSNNLKLNSGVKIFEKNIENNSNIVKISLSKRDIKSEIKKRKKYHRNLLEKYNDGFEEKYLNLISENSLILTSLRNELKS